MDVLNQDMERVAAFYQNHGYLDARVGKPEVSQSDDGLSITFPVMEGPRYRVGTVDMQGDLIKDKTELLNPSHTILPQKSVLTNPAFAKPYYNRRYIGENQEYPTMHIQV